jgi:hypothetical protein
MPVNTGQGGYNVGADVTLVINGPNGLVDPQIVTEFKKSQLTKEHTSTALDGVPRFGSQPAGWEGTFEIDRGNSVLDDLFAEMELDFFNGNSLWSFTISETITEVNGILSQYRFEGVAMRFENAGDAKGDDILTQTVSWRASFRKKVA